MSSHRIVIVADDDDDIRDCIAGVLKNEGIEVRTAPNGRAALDLLDALGDDRCVLLLDLMMPVVTGLDVLDQLARAGRLAALPVVVCSAVDDRDSLPSGVREVLGKPIHLDRLLEAVVPFVEEPPCPPCVSGLRAIDEPAGDDEEARERRLA